MANPCPICNQPLITPVGKSSILVLGMGFEEKDDDKFGGVPFTNQNGDVLRKELAANKVDWKRLRLDYLWGHPPMKAASRKKVDLAEANDLNEKCYNHFFGLLLATDWQAILLVGAEITKQITGCSVSEWAGVQMKSDYFDCLLMSTPKPSQVFSVPLGEVRLSMRKFCNEIRKRGYYD